MKNNLKTLKDLEKAMHVGDVKEHLFDENNEVGAEWMTSICLAGDLKAEAIKWRDEDSNWNDFLNWVEEMREKEELKNEKENKDWANVRNTRLNLISHNISIIDAIKLIEEKSRKLDDISNIDLVNYFIEYFFNLTEEDLK